MGTTESLVRAAAVLCAWAWVLAYAAVHVRRTGPVHWSDLTVVWLRNLGAVGLPSGRRAFLRGAVAAVPVNVVAALAVALGPTAATYGRFGSDARDKVFPPVVALVTGLMIAGFIRQNRGRGRPHPGADGPDSVVSG